MAEYSGRPFSQVVRTPGDFLKQAIGQQVYVKLHSGTEYHGTTGRAEAGPYIPCAYSLLGCGTGKLICLDGYMNIALGQAEEWIDGIRHRTYGDAFIRGNNGTGPPPWAQVTNSPPLLTGICV